MKKSKLIKVSSILKQFIYDLQPFSSKLDVKVDIKIIDKSEIKNFCRKNSDMMALNKMMIHELTKEPSEKIIALNSQNGNKIAKQRIDKILIDLGYNLYVLFSRNHKADYEAATNIYGYIIPGWKKLINFMKKFNINIAVFFGKRFAPGKSRLHIRIFEGDKYWYILAHIDRVNWINFNIFKVRRAHFVVGTGDYINGTKYFLKSLQEYFGHNQKTKYI